MKNYLLTILLITFYFNYGQYNEMQSQFKNAALVIEGEVVSSNAYVDKITKNIYTDFTIAVSQTLKGGFDDTIIVTVPGGSVDGFFQIVTHQVKLANASKGLFFLNNKKSSSQLYFKDLNGFVNYKKQSATELTSIKNQMLKIAPDFNDEVVESSKTPLVINSYLNDTFSITSFSPSELSAGSETELSIEGVGFGAFTGTVSFSQSDDGGETLLDANSTDIVSWSDSLIIVRVPSDAGSGPITVSKQDESSVTSIASLNIYFNYMRYNLEDDFGNLKSYPLRHVGAMPSGATPSYHNSDGALRFKMKEAFYNNDHARLIFIEIMEEWSCKTGVNFIYEGVASEFDMLETQNLISFADFEENGYGGAAFASLSGFYICGENDQRELCVTQIDITYDSNINWGYESIANNQFDFKWTTTHEIGHAALFGHVIDSNDLMHFSSAYGDRNFAGLQQTYVNAGVDKVAFSNSFFLCGSPMDVSTCHTLSLKNSNDNPLKLYVLANRIEIQSPASALSQFSLYDVAGKQIDSQLLLDSPHSFTYATDALTKGLYFVRIDLSKNRSITKKIML